MRCQRLHAILTIELSGNAGWETLIALAEEGGHDKLVDRFNDALVQERTHLSLVQTWYEETVGLSAAGLSGAGSASSDAGGMVRARAGVVPAPPAAGRISVPAPCAAPAAPRVAARQGNNRASRSLGKPAMSAQTAHFWRTWPTI